MTTNELSGQEGTDDAPTKSERRAEWEGFEFRVPVPGSVRVENVSYGDESGEHVYVVSVEGGIPFDCTCPAWEYHNPEGGCKHMVAVENQPAVTSAATNGQQVATDGGQPVADDEPTDASEHDSRDNHDTSEPTLPGIESFDDDTPSNETATVRFENGARYRYRITDDGHAYEEVYHPDDEDSPSVRVDMTELLHTGGSVTNAAEHLVDTLIGYEAYRDGEGYEQLRTDWGRPGIVDAVAGVPRGEGQ